MVGVLIFLATGFSVVAALVAAIWCGATRRGAQAVRIASLGFAVSAVYAAALVATSLASRETVLASGQEKFFCMADCDLAYSVVGVRRATVIPSPSGAAMARGEFLVVSIRVRSDAARVSVTASGARVAVVADDRSRFELSAEGQRALDAATCTTARLDATLPPGGSTVSEFVFDVPREVRHPRLLVTEGGWISRFVLGDENSFLHRKTTMRLTG